MSNKEDFNLKKIFGAKEKKIELNDDISPEEGTSNNTIKQEVAKEAKGVPWAIVLREIKKAVVSILNVNILDIIVQAWQRAGVFKDKKKYPPDKTVTQTLADHTIKVIYYPFLDLIIKHKKISKLGLAVDISITLKSATLNVEDQKLSKIDTADTVLNIKIKFKNNVIYKKTIKSLNIFKAIRLGDGGIPITPKDEKEDDEKKGVQSELNKDKNV